MRLEAQWNVFHATQGDGPDAERCGPPPLVAGQECWRFSPPHDDDGGYLCPLWSVTLSPCVKWHAGHSCGCIDFSVFRHIIANGRTHLVAVCKACRQRRTGPIPGGDWHSSDFPILVDDSRAAPPCERCGSQDGTERHHWAPHHLFSDADDWPTSYLCRQCHTRWHQVVTPNMARKVAA